ncbi:MAG TPA: hypothetical protein VGV92_00655 [Gammaproteobacteria bacterium]|nr:hypothetical protein [Gammaproteobacteria bacterium]
MFETKGNLMKKYVLYAIELYSGTMEGNFIPISNKETYEFDTLEEARAAAQRLKTPQKFYLIAEKSAVPSDTLKPLELFPT